MKDKRTGPIKTKANVRITQDKNVKPDALINKQASKPESRKAASVLRFATNQQRIDMNARKIDANIMFDVFEVT